MMNFSMRILLLLLFATLATSLVGQRKSIANLPAVNPEKVGFLQDSLNALDDVIDGFAQRDYRALIVIKDNQLAIEYYYNSFWRNHIHDIRSAGKSITALLLGVAIQKGYVQSVEQDVYSFFPKDKYPGIHEDYKKVKLIHLLNMVSGLDADSDDSSTPGNAGKWMAKDEWVTYLLSIPLSSKPGKRWVYADINAVLIGAVIEEASGMSLRDFAKQHAFDPMGITEFYWYTNASHQTGGAGNLYLSALDFAKLGVLVLNAGKWGDKQLVDADYIKHLIHENSSAIGDYNPLADGYGMLWYRSKRIVGGREVSYLWASGNGGNHLVVVPEENMVVATTSGAYGNWYPHKRAYFILGKLFQALEERKNNR
ncbi:MAG: serine hydrolase domain-containing protein [Bacteroidota bacterium]